MTISITKGPRRIYFTCPRCGTEFNCLASDCSFSDNISDRTWGVNCPTCEKACFHVEKKERR